MGKPEEQTGLAKNDKLTGAIGMKVWGKGERRAKRVRDRKEESEDFYPSSVYA